MRALFRQSVFRAYKKTGSVIISCIMVVVNTKNIVFLRDYGKL
jgi:hypothetical protein